MILPRSFYLFEGVCNRLGLKVIAARESGSFGVF